MRSLPLHGQKAAGRAALVSDEDYERASRHRWHVAGKYVATSLPRNGGKSKRLYLHTLVTGLKGPDHVNGDELDCQRTNLREATFAQNMANSKKRQIATSRYKGVYWHKQRGMWMARIKVDGRHRFLGRFADEDAAARAYDVAALAEWGEFARLNFSSPGPSECGSQD